MNYRVILKEKLTKIKQWIKYPTPKWDDLYQASLVVMWGVVSFLLLALGLFIMSRAQ